MKGICLIALALLGLLSFQGTLWGQTNGVLGSVRFENADLFQVAALAANLTQKPVAVSLNAGAMTINYQGQNVSREKVLKEIENRLREKGCAFADINGEYFKLVRSGETNKQGASPHVLITIHTNSIVFDNQPISLGDLPEAIKQRTSSGTEVWIHDGNRLSLDKARVKNNIGSAKVFSALIGDGVRPDRIYEAFLPQR